MTIILSKEELLADAVQLGSEEKRPPKVSSPTERVYDIVLKFWTEYVPVFPLLYTGFHQLMTKIHISH